MPFFRECRRVTVTLTTSATTTPGIPIEGFAGGHIHIPTGSSITTLTFYTAPVDGGTFLAAQDSTPTAVTMTVAAAKSYPLPAAVFGAAAMKIVGDAGGSVDINLKS